MSITNKREYYNLAMKGLLGNTIRMWLFPDWKAMPLVQLTTEQRTWSGWQCSWIVQPGQQVNEQGVPLWAVRSMNPADKGVQGYRLLSGDVMARARRAHAPDDVIVDIMAPDEGRTMQGEIMTDHRGLYLRYSTTPGLKMREAFDTMLHARGLTAATIFRHYADGATQDFVFDTLRERPDAIIEFSCFNRAVGVLHWNTIIWEVRENY